MDITFKLFASLGDYLPAEVRPGNEMRLTLPEGSCIMDVIVPFNLPAKMVHLVHKVLRVRQGMLMFTHLHLLLLLRNGKRQGQQEQTMKNMLT